MQITARHRGKFGQFNRSIELIVKSWSGNSTIIEDVTDLQGKVDEELIVSLKSIVSELERQNKEIDNQNK